MTTYEELMAQLNGGSSAPAISSGGTSYEQLMGQLSAKTPTQIPAPQKTKEEAMRDLLKAAVNELKVKSERPTATRTSVASAQNYLHRNAVRDAELDTARARRTFENIVMPEATAKALTPEEVTKETARITAKKALDDMVNATRNKGPRDYGGLVDRQDGLFGKDNSQLNTYVTNEQEATYNLLKDKNPDLADAYLRTVRKGATQEWAQDIVEGHNSDNVLSNFGLGFQSGMDKFVTGIKQLGNKLDVDDGAYTLAGQEVGQNLTGAQRVAFDLGNTTGYMALPLAGSAIIAAAGVPALVGGALAAGSFGTVSGANTYQEAVANGVSASDALTYGAINGALEGTLQFALGGIARFGGVGAKALGRAVTNSKAGTAALTKINNVSRALSSHPVLQKAFQGLETAGVYSGKASAEAVEEWTQAVLDPVVRNVVLGEHNEIKPFSEDKLYAAALGALSAGLMNAGTVRSAWQNTSTGKNNQIKKAQTAFMQEVDALARGQKAATTPLTIGDTPQILQNYGANPRQITISPSTIYKMAYPDGYMGGQHNLGFYAVENILDQLSHPTAILKSATQPNSQVIFTEFLDAENRPVMLALHLDKEGNLGISNDVASGYGRENFQSFIEEQRKAGNVLYENKKRGLDALPSMGLQLPLVASASDPMYKVAQEKGVVNPKDKSASVVNNQNSNPNGGGPGPNANWDVPEGNGPIGPSEFGTSNMQKAAAAGTVDQNVANAFKNGSHYTVGTDQSIAAASAAIEQLGTDRAVSYLTNKATGRKGLNSTETMAGLMLIQDLSRNGNAEAAIDLGNAMMEAASDTARALAIYRQLQQNLPGGLVRMVQATIQRRINDGKIKTDTLNEQDLADVAILDKLATEENLNGIDLTNASEDLKKWLNDLREVNEKIAAKNKLLAEAGKPERNEISLNSAAIGKALAIVEAKRKTTAREKIRGLQRIALLSNPKTHVRNITGNTLFTVGDIISSPISSLADLAISRSTGQRTYAGTGINIGERMRGMAEGLAEAVNEYKLGLDRGDKYTENNKPYGAKGKAFNSTNALGRLGNAIDGVIGAFLEIPDRAAMKAQYNNVLDQLMRANPKEVEANNGLPTPEMVDTALWSSLNITFKDDNKATDAMSAMRDAVGIAGDIIAPFTKTPTNVVLRGLEFSPVGWGEAFVKGFVGPNSLKQLKKNGESTMKVQREISQLIGRGFVGSALIVAGMYLKGAGAGTGDDADEVAKEQGWRQVTGEQPNSVKIGNKYYDISSIPPLSIPLLAGMATSGRMSWGNFFSAVSKLASSATDMPVLEGIRDIIGGGFKDKGAGEVAAQMLGDLATQVIPFISLSRQVANTTDPYARATGGEGEGVAKIASQTVNSIKASIPGLRQTLPQKYDVLDNPVKNYPADNAVERAFNIFLNPLNVSKENTDPTVQAINDIYKKTGNTAFLPKVAPNGSFNIGEEKVKLNPQEKQEWQKASGSVVAPGLESLVNSRDWKTATTEEQAKLATKLYDIGYQTAKDSYADTNNLKNEPESYVGYYDTLRSNGFDAGFSLSVLAKKSEAPYIAASYIYDHVQDQGQRDKAMESIGETCKKWVQGYNVYAAHYDTATYNKGYAIAASSRKGYDREQKIQDLMNTPELRLNTYGQAAKFYSIVNKS